jgi:hypothetical protein
MVDVEDDPRVSEELGTQGLSLKLKRMDDVSTVIAGFQKRALLVGDRNEGLK